MKLKTVSAIAFSSFLIACGGSSSDTPDNEDTSNGGGGGSGSGGSKTVTVSAKAQQATMCDSSLPTTSAELVIYDANWVEVSRHTADSAGIMQTTAPENAKLNFSVITRNKEDDQESFYINSFSEHPAGFLGDYYIPVVASTGCECKSTQINVVSELGNIDTNVNLSAAGTVSLVPAEKVAANQVTFESVRICRQPNHAWPIISVTANGAEAMVAGQLTNYNPDQVLQVNLTHPASIVNIQADSEMQRVTQLHYLEKAEVLSAELSAPFDQFSAFPQLQNLQRLAVSGVTEQLTVNGNTSTYSSRIGFQSKAIPANNLEISLPDQAVITQLEQFYETLTGQTQAYSLQNSSGLNLLTSIEMVMLKNGTMHGHIHNGPVQGILAPNLITQTVTFSDDQVLTHSKQLILASSSANQDYEELLKNRVSPAETEPSEITVKQAMVIVNTNNL